MKCYSVLLLILNYWILWSELMTCFHEWMRQLLQAKNKMILFSQAAVQCNYFHVNNYSHVYLHKYCS